MWKLLGGFIGTLAAKLLAFFAIYRSGEKAQSAKDTSATLEAVTRERDALATAGSAKEAAKHGEF
jgi:hypothetical protein